MTYAQKGLKKPTNNVSRFYVLVESIWTFLTRFEKVVLDQYISDPENGQNSSKSLSFKQTHLGYLQSLNHF